MGAAVVRAAAAKSGREAQGPAIRPRPHSTPGRLSAGTAWLGTVASSCWSRDLGPGGLMPALPLSVPTSQSALLQPTWPPFLPSQLSSAPGRPESAHPSSPRPPPRGLVTRLLSLSFHSCEMGRMHSPVTGSNASQKSHALAPGAGTLGG